jgi:hypothetical protein
MARSTILDMTADAGRLRRRRRFRVRVLLVAAVLGVVVAGAALWLRQALPRIAAAEIGRLMNARVETGAFDLRRDGSVSVAGLVIRPKEHESAYDNTILRAENVYAHFSWRSLLSLAPRVTDIRVENFLLDVQLDLQTGRWNVGSLRFHGSRGGGGGLPTISLQRGKLRYCKVGSQVQSTAGGVPVAGAAQEVVMSVPIEARFGRKAQAYPAYSFEIQTSKLSGGYGDSNLVGEWTLPVAGQAGRLTVAGGLSSTDIPSLERAWAVDVLAADLTYSRDGAYTLKLRMKDVHGKQSPEVDMLRFITPAMVGESGPLRKLQEFFAEYQPTGTVGSITIQATGNTKNWQESEIEGSLVCKDISVCDSDFPYQIDHLSGELEFTQSSLRANRLVGKHGNVDVRMDGWERGTGVNRQYQYQFVSRNMVLDKALYAALNPEQKELWDNFQPTGVVSVDYRLTRISPTDRRLYLSVDLNDVNAALRGFPYRLAGLTGNLFFDRESITISDVVSKTGGRQIQVNGKVTDRSGGKPGYYISIDAQNIPLDATLRDALPARHRELFRRCGLGGVADMRARVFSTSAAAVPGGPVGANDYSPVRPSAGGNANGVGDPNTPGAVSFLAEVVCREGTLRLPSAAPEPAGQTAGSGVPPQSGGSGPADGRSPVVSNITAEATITPKSLSIRKLNGQHGRSLVALTGSVQFGKDDALQQCRLKVTAEHVPLEETTIGLLPPSLARQVTAFRPAGDVNVVVDLKKAEGDERPEYAVAVDCLGDKIHHERFDYPLQDIRGTISFQKDSIALKGITARPQDGPISDSGLQEVIDTSPPSVRPAVIRVDGSATLTRGGLEKGSFTLQATDMRFTDEIGRALPKTLAGPYRELSPQGLFDLDLTTLKVSRAAENEAIVEFGGKVNLSPNSGNSSPEQKVARPDSSPPGSPGMDSSRNACHLKVSGTAVDLSGTVEAKGSYSTKRGLAKGRVRLAAERLVVKSKAVTHTNLEAIYDPNARKWVAEDFIGDCYGGRLLGSLEIGPTVPRAEEHREETRGLPVPAGFEYVLQVAFNDVDLQQFLLAGKSEDRSQKPPDRALPSTVRSPSSTSSGTMDVWLSLNARIGDEVRSGTAGEGAATRSPEGPRRAAPGAGRRGVCHVDIANMQVGKVSALGNVLSVLRFSEPTDYTFERMSIDSYIRADKLLIPKLDLSGRSAAFTGSGTMDLPTEEINLMLTARGARVAAAEPSVLQSLTEGLSGAMVRMEVTGKASSPRVQTKALPVIEDSLRILGTPGEGKKGEKGKG